MGVEPPSCTHARHASIHPPLLPFVPGAGSHLSCTALHSSARWCDTVVKYCSSRRSPNKQHPPFPLFVCPAVVSRELSRGDRCGAGLCGGGLQGAAGSESQVVHHGVGPRGVHGGEALPSTSLSGPILHPGTPHPSGRLFGGRGGVVL